jgi:hypothetical protein
MADRQRKGAVMSTGSVAPPPVRLGKETAHLAGLRAGINVLDNLVLTAYWTYGDDVYGALVDLMNGFAAQLAQVQPPTGAPDPTTTAARLSNQCPSGTRPIDGICVPE